MRLQMAIALVLVLCLLIAAQIPAPAAASEANYYYGESLSVHSLLVALHRCLEANKVLKLSSGSYHGYRSCLADDFIDIEKTAFTIWYEYVPLYELTDLPEFLKLAEESAVFLLHTQNKSNVPETRGGWVYLWDYTADAPKSTTINTIATACSVFALARLYEATHNTTYLYGAKLGAEWLIRNIETHGGAISWDYDWSTSSWNDLVSPNSFYALTALAYLYKITGNTTYLNYAERLASWILNLPREHSALFLTYNITSGQNTTDKLYPHYTLETAEGFYWLYKLTGNTTYLDFFETVLESMMTFFYAGNGLIYDKYDTSSGSFTDYCMTLSTRQLAFLFLDLYCLTRNQTYLDWAKLFLNSTIFFQLDTFLRGTWFFYQFPNGTAYRPEYNVTWGYYTYAAVKYLRSFITPPYCLYAGADVLEHDFDFVWKELRITINTTELTTLVINASSYGMPTAVVIPGASLVSPLPTWEDFIKADYECWYYSSTTNLVYIKVRGHSPVLVKVVWAGQGGPTPGPTPPGQPPRAGRQEQTRLFIAAVVVALIAIVVFVVRKKP